MSYRDIFKHYTRFKLSNGRKLRKIDNYCYLDLSSVNIDPANYNLLDDGLYNLKLTKNLDVVFLAPTLRFFDPSPYKVMMLDIFNDFVVSMEDIPPGSFNPTYRAISWNTSISDPGVYYTSSYTPLDENSTNNIFGEFYGSFDYNGRRYLGDGKYFYQYLEMILDSYPKTNNRVVLNYFTPMAWVDHTVAEWSDLATRLRDAGYIFNIFDFDDPDVSNLDISVYRQKVSAITTITGGKRYNINDGYNTHKQEIFDAALLYLDGVVGFQTHKLFSENLEVVIADEIGNIQFSGTMVSKDGYAAITLPGFLNGMTCKMKIFYEGSNILIKEYDVYINS